MTPSKSSASCALLYFFNFSFSFPCAMLLLFFCVLYEKNMPRAKDFLYSFFHFAGSALQNRPSGSKLCCLLSVVDYLFPLRCSSFFFSYFAKKQNSTQTHISSHTALHRLQFFAHSISRLRLNSSTIHMLFPFSSSDRVCSHSTDCSKKEQFHW